MDKETIKELIEELENHIEKMESQFIPNEEEFPTGFHEGFNYGLEFVIEKLKRIQEDE